jgi:hypothetical protein
MVAPDQAHAAGGVARRVQGAQHLAAETEGVAMRQLHARCADVAAHGGRRFGARQFGQLAGTGDVVCVRVGLHRPDQCQAVLAQHGEVALDLVIDRIDDQGVAGGLVEQHVREGAGRGVEELDRFHVA